MPSDTDARGTERRGPVEAFVDMMVGLVTLDHTLNRAKPEPPDDSQSGEFTAVRHHGYLAVFDGDECVMKLDYVDADQLVTEISGTLYSEVETDVE